MVWSVWFVLWVALGLLRLRGKHRLRRWGSRDEKPGRTRRVVGGVFVVAFL